jgi:hypothetical protein
MICEEEEIRLERSLKFLIEKIWILILCNSTIYEMLLVK